MTWTSVPAENHYAPPLLSKRTVFLPDETVHFIDARPYVPKQNIGTFDPGLREGLMVKIKHGLRFFANPAVHSGSGANSRNL
jgi:hypothetical protein